MPNRGVYNNIMLKTVEKENILFCIYKLTMLV